MDNYTPGLIGGLRPIGRGSIQSAHERPERIGGKVDWAKILGNAQGALVITSRRVRAAGFLLLSVVGCRECIFSGRFRRSILIRNNRPVERPASSRPIGNEANPRKVGK